MTAVIILAVLALVFATVWFYLADHPGPRAKLGPDGTNVREPETFVVHHEGKGQGLDIANTALKKRTEDPRRDLPGDAHKVKTPVPGRDLVRMDAPPSDESRYGAEKVAPGAVPGMPGAESKETVLTQGPRGSRPETPEEPGSSYAKGRRVTDTHRDVELAADLLPNIFPGAGRQVVPKQAASPSTNGQEPGYGLGRTGPRRADGEGGDEDDDSPHAPYPTEQPDLVDDIPDMPEGDMPMASTNKESLSALRHDTLDVLFEADEMLPEVTFHPDPAFHVEGDTWSHLFEDLPLTDVYGEDMVVVLVRNPRSLYVYWDRSGYGDENLQSVLGEQWEHTVPVLRVFDVTSGAYPGQPGGHSFIIRVGEFDNHWFVNHGIAPGRRYIVSYERMEPSGRTHLVTHSAPVQTPSEGPAPGAPSLLYERYGESPAVRGVVSSWRQAGI